MKKTLTFLGCGNMAGAIIAGAGNTSIVIYDKNTAQYEKYTGKSNITTAPTAEEAIAKGDYIFLCVKPQNCDELLSQIDKKLFEGKIVVSIMAGITISRLSSLAGDCGIIRAMPNTPLMLGKGVTGLSRNGKVSDKIFSEICRLFSEMGEVMVVSEDKINAVTSASGSAPAYVYLLIKAIAEEAKAEGLADIKDLEKVIARMVQGSCEMVIKTGLSTDELIRMVKSPNGTTERALNVFEKEDFCGMVSRAMQDCNKRAAELAGE